MTIHKGVFIYILLMALTTYVIRMAPFVLFRRKIKSRFARSFVFYVPYTVLGAMTIPGIFYSTGNIYSALAGFIVAGVMAYKKCSLILVALAACAAAYITGLFI
ncbi:MAG: AzlD domain-containing protein [Oscillospiraceae bacterium]|nr:AzlD domain-containing protein [Oscillospiraceae bacterium]